MDDYTPTSDEERTALSTALKVRATVQDAVRKQYPYMKSDTLDRLLNENQDHLVRKILEQESEHRQTKARSSFFSLSAELRNRIYAIALEDSFVLQDSRWGKQLQFSPNPEADTPTGYPMEIRGERPALLQVNKQVRNETLPMYYGSHPLYADLGNPTLGGYFSGPHPCYEYKATSTNHVLGSALAMRRYLRDIGPEQAGMIKRIWIPNDLNVEKEEFLRANELLDLGVAPEAWELFSTPYYDERRGWFPFRE